MNEDIKEKRLGNLNGFTGGSFAGQVYSLEGISPSLTTMEGGGRQPHIVIEDSKNIIPAAMRGRYREDGTTEQHLEIHDDGISNTITSVEKDALIMEENKIRISQATKKGYIEMENGGVADLSFPTSRKRRGRVQGDGNICPTLPTSPSGIHKIDREPINENMTKEELIKRYRIRKLTEREVWRVMDFSDNDFEKANAVNSKTQLYKEAGNSICRNCLVAIFGQLFEGKENVYKKDRIIKN